MNKDINLFYSGGSGGFFALHCLLLSGEFECCFQNGQTFEQAFAKQWAITDGSKWKTNEVWPDNNKTLELTTGKRKIYFFLIGNEYAFQDYKNYNFLIYTDLKTQWELSSYKKAYWFAGNENSFAGENWRDNFIKCFYNDFKAEHWPDCNNYEEFLNLPKNIKIEMEQHLNYYNKNLESACLTFENLTSIQYNGRKVDDTLGQILSTVDKAVLLQEIVQTQAKNLYSMLGLEYNQAVSDFVDHWLSLHPQHIQNLLEEI